ncbi:ADP-ribosylglycohydrolase family protein [Pseudomarimonas arenosa]|nr:ADP-ribosylglycohydrolase family protein [Pseudomarimonas arenosa]
MRDRVSGGLFGLLIGDALGVPYEFHRPEMLPPLAEIDMLPPPDFERAHIGTPPGTWSDDGAQALALLASLLDCDGLDVDEFGRRLLAWIEQGAYAVDARVFDVGVQTQRALTALAQGESATTTGPASERDNGNGSLMRVLPLTLWHRGNDTELFGLAMRQSLPTHGHLRSQLCCAVYCLWARRLLEGAGGWDEAVTSADTIIDVSSDELQAEWLRLKSELGSPRGSGYVVDTLDSARWAMDQGDDYASVVRAAISLGYDTDTTAAVAGGLAGIRFGLTGIPNEWIDRLKGREILDPLMRRLLERA